MLNDFLSTILPTQGVYYAARWVPNPNFPRGGYFTHSPASDTPDELALAVKVLIRDHPTSEIYYAMAGFMDVLEAPPRDDGKPIRHTRKQEYALAARSMWVDLDCGEGKDYPSQKAALDALFKFVNTCALPKPTYVVSSGYGVHAYWAFTQDIKRPDWERVAQMFDALTRARGLKIDHKVTTDIARVLRPLGTSNNKRETPAPVTGRRMADPVGFGGWARAIRDALLAVGVNPQDAVKKASQKARQPSELDDLTGGQTYPPSDADRIADRCRFIGSARTLKGADMAEPEWYRAMGVLQFTVQGDAVCHEWSSGHPEYSAAACQAKVDQWREKARGPACCDDIRSITTLCEGCTRKVTTPVVLGYPEAQHATVVPAAEPGGEDERIPELPDVVHKDFRFVADLGLCFMMESEEGDKFPVPISSQFVVFDYLYCDPNESEHYARIRVRARPGQWESYDISAEAIGKGGTAITGELAKVAGVTTSNPKEMARYMQTWYDHMRASLDLQLMRAHFGWQEDGGFVLGRRYYKEDGVTAECSVAKSIAKYADAYTPKGDLESQVRLIDQLYNRPGYEAFQFVLAASLGSALVPLVHDGPVGIPVLLWSAGSGKGKTTVCHNAIRHWATPTANAQAAQANGATEHALFEMAGLRRHLPTLVDEATEWDADRISRFVYQYASGSAKLQGKADGGLRDNSGKNWSSFLFMTSNTSLIATMSASIRNAGPRIARIFEIQMPDIKLDVHDGPLIRDLAKHSGHIGDQFARYLVTHQDAVRQRVEAMIDDIKNTVDDSTDARFWVLAAACTTVAAQIAYELGLFLFDVGRLEQWSRHQIKVLRRHVEESIDDAEGMLERLISHLQPGTLVTNKLGRKGEPALIDPNFPAPRNKELLARFTTVDSEMYVPVRVIKEWCAGQSLSMTYVREMFEKTGWLLSSDARISLGQGTPIAFTRGRCWHLKAPGVHLQAVAA